MTINELRAQATVPVGDGYHAFAGALYMAPTLEDCEFLYALVRVTKPGLVVETGTGLGVSATFIATALADNKLGELFTFEPNLEYAAQARESLRGLPAKVVTGSYAGRSLKKEPNLVFIDSGVHSRSDEIVDWLKSEYKGLVCIHDANRDYSGTAYGTGVFLPGSDGLWLGRAK